MSKARCVVYVMTVALLLGGCPDKAPPPTGGFDTSDTGPDPVPDPDVIPDVPTTEDVGEDSTPTADVVADASDVEGPTPDGDAAATTDDTADGTTTDPDVEIIEGGCTDDDQCSDLGDGCCAVGVCVAGECEAQTLEDCCAGSNDDCEDDNTLTTDVCASLCEVGGCVHSVEVCAEAPLYI
ncbi:MAG: hypothetical protein QF464_21425, partial [Myxococcota bacterium]|nr:hypothetical protein [Myxococcota bacterium]